MDAPFYHASLTSGSFYLIFNQIGQYQIYLKLNKFFTEKSCQKDKVLTGRKTMLTFFAKDISSNARLIAEFERLTIEAQPTRWSPIPVLTRTSAE